MTMSAVDHRTRQRLLEAANNLLSTEGFVPDLLARVAKQAACPLDRAHVFFHCDEDVIMALYARFAADLEARVMDLPEAGVAQRFRAAMEAKFSILAPYRRALAALMDTMMDSNHALGVLNPQTEMIRARVQGVFASVVQGAGDRPARNPDRLVRALYTTHLALVLRWCRKGPDNALATLKRACGMLNVALPYLGLPLVRWAGGPLDVLLKRFLEPSDKHTDELAALILRRLFRHRRLRANAGACSPRPCDHCLALHLAKVTYFVRAKQPIHLVLPAFPAKSPSRRKTLGPLPDRAEEEALVYLGNVCKDLAELYAPGVRVTLCSDGHVFSDVVGVSDDDVTAYGTELRDMIRRLNLRSLDWFELSDVYEKRDYRSIRERLVADYARPLQEVEDRARRFDHARSIFNGIHRFIYEEQVDVQPNRSKSKIRNDCRNRAFQVIQRSEAWSRLLADCFPAALRLSIHPQSPHSEKIGILLGAADDAWITPWHGVVVQTASGWRFMKRSEAEATGARLVERHCRPSHFEMPDAVEGAAR